MLGLIQSFMCAAIYKQYLKLCSAQYLLNLFEVDVINMACVVNGLPSIFIYTEGIIGVKFVV